MVTDSSAPTMRRTRDRMSALGLAPIRSRSRLLVVLIALLSGVMSFAYPTFPTGPNIAAVLLDTAQAGILVVGMTVLMIGGVFDLSIGGILAMSGIVAGILAKDWSVAAPLALLAGILIGAACGLFNGVVVTRLRINALIATLATVGIFRGITQLISASGVNEIGDSFSAFGQAVILGLQSPFWVMLIVVLVGEFAVSRMRFFRQFYYIGGNARAATLSGIKVDRVMLLAFVFMGRSPASPAWSARHASMRRSSTPARASSPR